MATKISVELTDDLYQRMQDFARLHQQPLEQAIPALLEQALIAEEVDDETIHWSNLDPAVAREMKAYIDLLPILEQHHMGEHVAIYNGKLVDHDQDLGVLLTRIDNAYPEVYVWMSKVGDELMPTFYHRSPRLV